MDTQTPPHTFIEERRAICNACEFRGEIPLLTKKLSICTKCYCPLQSKTATKSTQCPQGKWSRVES